MNEALDPKQALTGDVHLAGLISPKLLFVVNDAGFFLSHRLPIAQAARAAGFEVHVATPSGADATQVTAQGFSFHPVPITRRGINPLSELRSIFVLRRLFRRLRPAIIHAVTIKPVIYGGIAARGVRGCAVVSAISGLGFIFVGRTLLARMLRPLATLGYRVALSRRPNKVVIQNSADRDLLLGSGIVHPGQLVMIPGAGVDLRRFAAEPEPNGTPVVLCATRMLWDKGVREFVEAARRLRDAGVKARFVLAGDTDTGNPRAIPTTTLTSWRDAGIVEWEGFCSDMPGALAKSNIVCLPSYREGLPKVLLESAAAGRAIVTTDTPGCRDVVRDGDNGLLVPVGDVDALAAALKELIENASLRARMGARGRAIAESEYGVERVIHSTVSLYRALLAECPSS